MTFVLKCKVTIKIWKKSQIHVLIDIYSNKMRERENNRNNKVIHVHYKCCRQIDGKRERERERKREMNG